MWIANDSNVGELPEERLRVEYSSFLANNSRFISDLSEKKYIETRKHCRTSAMLLRIRNFENSLQIIEVE